MDENYRIIKSILKVYKNVVFFDSGKELETVRDLITRPGACDGLLLLSCSEEGELVAELVRRYDFPHITSDERAEWLNMNTVRSHSDYGIRQAVKHLQTLGHERIGYVGARDSHRYPSLVAQLAAQQLPIDVTWHCWIKWTLETNWPQQWRSVAHQAFLEHLDRQPEATAYLCTNDMVGLGVVDALQACGLEPGRDVSLVGYDNYEQRVLGEAKPILTTIDNPGDVVGAHAAVRLLNQILHGQTEIAQVRIPTQLIVRETTGPCL